MKIIEYFNQNYDENVVDKISKNIKGFNYLEIEENEFYDEMRKIFLQRNNWALKSIYKIELQDFTIDWKILEDENIYPILTYSFEAYENQGFFYKTGNIVAKFSPFECVSVEGASFSSFVRGRFSLDFTNLLEKKYGITYIQKRREYFETVKNLKIGKAKAEADLKIKEAEQEFEDNLI